MNSNAQAQAQRKLVTQYYSKQEYAADKHMDGTFIMKPEWLRVAVVTKPIELYVLANLLHGKQPDALLASGDIVMVYRYVSSEPGYWHMASEYGLTMLTKAQEEFDALGLSMLGELGA